MSWSPRQLREEPLSDSLPLLTNPLWTERFPWLVQGITAPGSDSEPFDLGLWGSQPVGTVLERWAKLRAELGIHSAVHSRQVHGARILSHTGNAAGGLLLVAGYDGHLTEAPDVLLTVSVADCVPVTVVDESRRTIALVHAGWRGTAAGIVQLAIDLVSGPMTENGNLWLHAGPAICGSCYEVGPEVHEALLSPDPPTEPTPIDLRLAIANRAAAAGVPEDHISLSSLCTRCGPEAFFSHRGGSAGRQMAFVAMR